MSTGRNALSLHTNIYLEWRVIHTYAMELVSYPRKRHFLPMLSHLWIVALSCTWYMDWSFCSPFVVGSFIPPEAKRKSLVRDSKLQRTKVHRKMLWKSSKNGQYSNGWRQCTGVPSWGQFIQDHLLQQIFSIVPGTLRKHLANTWYLINLDALLVKLIQPTSHFHCLYFFFSLAHAIKVIQMLVPLAPNWRDL